MTNHKDEKEVLGDKTEPGSALAPAGQPPAGRIFDYRSGKALPSWVQEVIEAHLAMEAEDAKSAGAMGFMARALVVATMPYKDPKADVFKRENGNFRLRIVAGYEGGIPYGIYPRLLMSWLTTEAVLKKSPVIELGDSLSEFLREVLELRSSSGGVRGTGSRVTEQMKRLFGSMVSVNYHDPSETNKKDFALRNILIADELRVDEDEANRLWDPQATEQAGRWRSQVVLNHRFYTEVVERPVPIDLRAYKALRGSPLAMDILVWLSYRMSYLRGSSRPIPYEGLMGQFGSGFSSGHAQAVRDFKKAFLKAFRLVQVVYPKANVTFTDRGLVLKASPTLIAMPSPQRKPKGKDQGNLF